MIDVNLYHNLRVTIDSLQKTYALKYLANPENFPY